MGERCFRARARPAAAGRALDESLLTFINAQPLTIRTKLAEWGLLDKQQVAAGVLLATVTRKKAPGGKESITVTGGHLLDYKASLDAQQLAPMHILQVVNQCVRLCEGARFRYPADVDSVRLDAFLLSLQKQGLSAWTLKTYLTAFRSFCNWLTLKGRLPTGVMDQLKQLVSLNPDADRRRIRRAMTEAEIEALIPAAMSGKKHHGLTGLERTLVYRLALETGLRWNEIVTLTRSNFHLDEKPYVSLGAADAKNGKDDVLPVSPELAGDLAAYFRKNPARLLAKAFAGIWQKKGADMLEKDLNAAGISAVDETGEVLDFHSLRHTCGTRLARAGVSPQIAVRIMRHSSMDLTLKYYTHLALEDERGAIEKLPAIRSSATTFPSLPASTGEIADTKTDTNVCPNRVRLRHRVSLLGRNDSQTNMHISVKKKNHIS